MRQTRFLRLIVTLAVTVGGCTQSRPRASYLDDTRAVHASLIVQGKSVEMDPFGSKYCWHKVQVIKVLANTSGRDVGEFLRVAHYSWLNCMPSEESTLYLVLYNESHPDYGWRALQDERDRRDFDKTQ